MIIAMWGTVPAERPNPRLAALLLVWLATFGLGLLFGSMHTAGLATRDHEDAEQLRHELAIRDSEIERCLALSERVAYRAEAAQATVYALLRARALPVAEVEEDGP